MFFLLCPQAIDQKFKFATSFKFAESFRFAKS